MVADTGCEHGIGTYWMQMPTMARHIGSEDMRKEFETELARRVSGKKKERKMVGAVWISLALGAVILAGSALTVAAQWTGGENGNGTLYGDQDQIRDPLENPDCTCDCDGTCDNDSDGDGICDCKEDGTCTP